MDKLIPLGLWLAVAMAFFLVLGALTAEAGEREGRRRTVAVEKIEDLRGYRAPCPRVDRYTRDLGNCRQAWEPVRPRIVLQPKGKGTQRRVR